MLDWEIEVILNSTHDGMIVINNDAIITLFNKAAEKLTRIKAEDALKKPVVDVVENTRLPHVLKTGKAELNREQLPHVLKTGKAELNREQLLGDIRIVTSRMPIKDKEDNIIGAMAVFRDISEIQEMVSQVTNLREIQSMLEAIFNSTQDAISVVDQNGIGVMVNPAYTRVTGLTSEEVIGKPATVLRVGPSKKDVIIDAAPIIVDGELRGSVGVIHDISEIKKLTEELDQAKQIIRKLEAKCRRLLTEQRKLPNCLLRYYCGERAERVKNYLLMRFTMPAVGNLTSSSE